MRSTVRPITGGWIVAVEDGCARRIEYSASARWCALFSQSSMCGMKPSGCTPCSRQRTSCFASSALTCSSAMAMKAESHHHWNGYVEGDGQVKSYFLPSQPETPDWRF